MHQSGIIGKFVSALGQGLRALICLSMVVSASFHPVEANDVAGTGLLVQITADQSPGPYTPGCDRSLHLTCATSVMCHTVTLVTALSMPEPTSQPPTWRRQSASLHGRNLLPLLHPPKPFA
jgi:hypothetical protein